MSKKNKLIHYLATKEGVLAEFQKLYAGQGFEFTKYTPLIEPKKIFYLFLIEPLIINQHHYAVSRLWKHWLMHYASHVHLVVAAFSGNNLHSNFLSLLELPENLGDFLTTTETVATFQPVYSGVKEKFGLKNEQYIDSWEVGLPHSGEPAKNMMERFLRGHDKANSFFEQLTRLRKEMINLETALEQKKPAESFYLNIEKEFKYLLNRWYRYEQLMDFLPFKPELDLIFEEMQSIKNLLGSKEWQEKSAEPKLSSIERIKEILKEHIVPIVHAEDYW